MKTNPALMGTKFKIFLTGFFSVIPLLSFFPANIYAQQVDPSTQITQYVNPILVQPTANGPWIYQSGDSKEMSNAVTNNDTSVTLLYTNLEPGRCYVLSNGSIRKGEQVDQEANQDGEHFYKVQGYDFGWTNNPFAKQAGGGSSLCGFDNQPDGSGPDDPASYLRADQNGNIWFYNLCENMEGIRQDCNAKFALGARYSQQLFVVTCYYQTHGLNLDQGERTPDPMCDLSKAKLKDGTPRLRIWGWDSGNAPAYLMNYDSSYTNNQGCIPNPNAPSMYGYDFRSCTASGFREIPKVFYFEVFTATKKSSSQFEINSNTVKTEFGNIPRDPAELATVVLRIALGVGGGIAFLLMVYGSLRLIFAAGNPESVQQGREIITAAIVGLLVIILSTFILQLIGISILGIKL